MSELSANQTSQTFTTHSPSMVFTKSIFSSLSDRIGLLAAWVSNINTNFKSKFRRSGNKNRKEVGGIRQMDELPIANAFPPRYLLLCISTWKGYYLTQMLPVNLNVSNDEILFSQLKSAYHSQVGMWKRIISLRCIKDIRFVRVSDILLN